MIVGLPESNGYIYIEANGGLNQQRTSVIYFWQMLVIYTFSVYLDYLALLTIS